jgi:unsaturated chondroitin disaccharide hydrolase
LNGNSEWVNRAWRQTVAKTRKTGSRIGSGFPHVSINGQYDSAPPSWWTAGFWPGLLWLLYRDTKDEWFKQTAEQCEEKLDQVLDEFYGLHHDVGFMWSLTSVANYKLSGNEVSRKRALHAANILAGRFNPKGKFIRAWNDGPVTGWAIVDCMMNLCILYWASEATGDPRFKHIAMEHANMAAQHFIRKDGSSYHIVSFDPETGERIEAIGGQGYAAESAWSRGNAWALYGFTLSYLYTKEQAYLDTAKRLAHYFIANLPEDHVPFWDFRLPSLEGMPRDSSAGACAASGLLELAKLVPPDESRMYEQAGFRMVRSLYESYGAWDSEEEGLIIGGTGNFPKNGNVDVPLIYGDYFFVEALAKLRGQTELFW